LLPDTGASTNMTSGLSWPSLLAISMVSVTPIVPICAHTAPGANASATPPSKTTEVTTPAVGSIVITTRASLTASAADAATRAPAPASGAVADADRSHTVVSSPAAIRLRAIADPMIPVPSTATGSWLSLIKPKPPIEERAVVPVPGSAHRNRGGMRRW
jgi:hypothetical protein